MLTISGVLSGRYRTSVECSSRDRLGALETRFRIASRVPTISSLYRKAGREPMAAGCATRRGDGGRRGGCLYAGRIRLSRFPGELRARQPGVLASGRRLPGSSGPVGSPRYATMEALVVRPVAGRTRLGVAAGPSCPHIDGETGATAQCL